jgi:hypothetical protein
VQDWGCNAVADTLEDDRPTLDVTLADRRRPGRTEYHSDHLIALLRDQPTTTNLTMAEDAAPEVLSVDDLAPARGMLIGLPTAAAMWAVSIFAIWSFV